MKQHDCQNFQSELHRAFCDDDFSNGDFLVNAATINCADCQTELAATREALRAYRAASALDVPDENYWLNYEQSLQNALTAEITGASGAQTLTRRNNWRDKSFWQNLWSGSIRVPGYAVAALVLLFAMSSIVTVRSLLFAPAAQIITVTVPAASSEQNFAAAQQIAAPAATPQVVIQERIVWRERIVTQKANAPSSRSNAASKDAAPKNTLAAARRKPVTAAAPEVSPLNLAEFKPSGQLNLQIVSEEAKDEK